MKYEHEIQANKEEEAENRMIRIQIIKDTSFLTLFLLTSTIRLLHEAAKDLPNWRNKQPNSFNIY